MISYKELIMLIKYTENQISHLEKVFNLIEDNELDKMDDIKLSKLITQFKGIENNIKINKESYFYTKYFKN